MDRMMPSDGWNDIEEKILGHCSIYFMYRRIKSPIDKFIIMARYQVGYTQEEIAGILKISQEAISKRIKNAKKTLNQ